TTERPATGAAGPRLGPGGHGASGEADDGCAGNPVAECLAPDGEDGGKIEDQAVEHGKNDLRFEAARVHGDYASVRVEGPEGVREAVGVVGILLRKVPDSWLERGQSLL